MDALESFAQIVGSRPFKAAALVTAAGAGGHAVLQGVRWRLLSRDRRGLDWKSSPSIPTATAPRGYASE